MSVKFKKCEIWLDLIVFLCYVFTTKETESPTKVEAVIKWSTPTNVGEVRSFLGIIEDLLKNSPK